MESKIIQQYLDHQIIKIEAESELTSVKTSVSQVKALLGGNNSTIITAVMIVLDPDVKDDALVTSVNGIILENWKLFRNKNKNEKAVSIIRATILEALDQIVSEDVDRLGVVWLAAKHIYPLSSLGKDQKIIKPWLENIGNHYLKESYEEWGVPVLQRGAIRVDKISKLIEKGIVDGFSGLDQISIAQNPAEWKKEFSTLLTGTLSSVLAKQFGVKELSDALNALNKRNQLIWLKESNYSHTLDSSYNDLDEKLRPLALALDISNLTSRFIPNSISSFMHRTLQDLGGLADTKLSLKEFFEVFNKSNNIKPLLKFLPDQHSRSNIVQFLSLLAEDKDNLKQAEKVTGIKPTLQITYGELATWLLDDFLALKNHE